MTRRLPCPFCGAAGRSLVGEKQDTYAGMTHSIICTNCGAVGPEVQPGVDVDGNWTKADALKAWNTRSGK